MNFNKIEKHLKKIRTNKSNKQNLKNPARWWYRKGCTIYLDDEDLKSYYKILNSIISDEVISYCFTLKEIDNLLMEVITNLFKNKSKTSINKKIKLEINNLKTKLFSDISDWEFTIPLENITFDRKTNLSNITFLKYNKYWLNRNLKKLRDILKNNSHYNEEFKEKLIERQKRLFLENLLGEYCAKINIRGTYDGAREKAIQKIEELLSLIKLHSFSSDSLNHMSYFGIKGSIIRSSHRVLIGSKQNNLTPSIERVGYLFPYNFHDTNKQIHRKKGGFLKTLKLLKDQRNNLEKRILTSIYWHSKAFDIPIVSKKKGFHDRRENYVSNRFNLSQKFINLIISLESLLIFGREVKSKNVSNRASYILSKNTLDREHTRKLFKRIYDIRSKIVHEGYNLISQEDVRLLIDYSKGIIINVIIKKANLKWKNSKDFYVWLEKERINEAKIKN